VSVPHQVKSQSEAVEAYYRTLDEAPSDEGQPTEDLNTTDAELVDDQQVEPAEAAAVSDEEETYAQRYRSLQGMYNAEVPRLHQQVKEQTSRLGELELLLSQMQTPSSAPEATEYTPPVYISDADVQEYGESIDVMRKVSRDEIGALEHRMAELQQSLEDINRNVVPQVAQVAHQQANSDSNQFWADINRTVPNWREIQADPDFQTWLLEVNPLTGKPLQSYLSEAQETFDSARAISFFTTWQEAQSNTSPVAAEPERASASELERQVSPGRTRAAQAPSDSGGPTYSPTDIKNFFNDVRNGKYRGKEKERDRIERDIFAAQRDGRIVMDA